MIKFVLKLALTALIANATWQVGSAYLSHYRFKDAAREATLTPRVTDEQLRARIIELATEFDAALDDENLVITRDQRHIVVDVSYVRSIEAVPGFPYPWQFAWSIEVFIIPGAVPVTH
jgi:hypothetical protein